MPPSTNTPRTRETLLALLVSVALAAFWIATLPSDKSWGWDESMHAELPAARMLVAVQEGHPAQAWDTLLDCQQYPFVWPLVLAAVQAVTGIGEHACRVAGLVAWCLTLLGVFLAGVELARALAPRSTAARWIPWFALAFAALSPLALAFAGTLFLEVPFACVAVWCLRAWLRRDGTLTRELAAGEWLTLALFTKFNYGLLLWAGLGLAWLFDAIAARAELVRFARRTLVLALVPLLACLWWFVLVRGAEHREALLSFLQGNRELGTHTLGERLLHAGLSLHATPRLLLLVLVLAMCSLRVLRTPGVRALACLALALVLPAWTHPFHLDRFLVPQAIPLWLLAGTGAAFALRPLVVAGLLVLALPGGFDRVWLAGATGHLSSEARVREYQLGIYARWRELGAARDLPSGGLERGVHDALAAAIVAAAGPRERVGWLGMSNEFSPAALHLARLAAGMERERFLSESARKLDLDSFGGGPEPYAMQHVHDFVLGRDLVLYARPIDLRGRKGREGMMRYVDGLVTSLGWHPREIARVSVARPLSSPLEVSLFACRPKPR